MTPDSFDQLLHDLMVRQPFKPFIIELIGGTRFEIDSRYAARFDSGKAVFVTPSTVPMYFESDSVLRVLD